MVFPLRKYNGSYVAFLTRVHPGHDDAGDKTGWFGINTDISVQVAAEKNLEVLSTELSHRIKNIFSVVAGLVSVSAKSYPESRAFATDLDHRIAALASAHDFIRPHVNSTPDASPSTLIALLSQLLAPYQQRDRVSISGDNLVVTEQAMLALALMVHELVTHSVKYGALSVLGGRLAISCRVSDHALHIDWSEHDGPPVAKPSRLGFGSNLTRISIEAQLAVRITYDRKPRGLNVCATVPLQNVAQANP